MAHKYKKLYITCGIFLVIAIALLLIGGAMAGWDIAAWFNWEENKYLQTTTIAVVSLLLIWVGFAVANRLNKYLK